MRAYADQVIQGLRRVVLFDGQCATCNRALTFIAPRLPGDFDLSFVALESPLAASLLAQRPLDHDRDSLVYLDDAELLQGAAAVKRVLSYLPRWRVVGRMLEALPDSWTESAYDVFAEQRSRWNTRFTLCEVPSAQLAARLLSQ